LGAGVHIHPYYLEPNYGGWEGTAPASLEQDPRRHAVVAYNELLKLSTANLCILQPLLDPADCCQGFEDIALRHLLMKRKIIIATLDSWMRKAGNASAFPSALYQIFHELMKTFYAKIGIEEIRRDLTEIKEELHFIRR